MPYRPKDIYRGRRKFRVPLMVGLFILAFLLIGTVGLFYFLQQFLVYDQTGVSLQLPFMASGTEAEEDGEEASQEPEPTFAPVEVQVVYEDPDFSEVNLGGWEGLTPTKARFVPLSEARDEMKLNAAVNAAAGDYTGVVLELKDESGMLAWASQSETAIGYGTSGAMDYTETVEAIHEKGLTAAAQISCLADELLATRNPTVTLKTEAGSYKDSNGVYWLDPYNRYVRNYIADLMEELSAMGFDEIILADLYHPVRSGYGNSGDSWEDDWEDDSWEEDWSEEGENTDAEEAPPSPTPAGIDTGFLYSVTIQTAPNPVNAICQMALRLAESMEGTETAVSAVIDQNSLLSGNSVMTGQDMDIFWRIFARLYCPCSIYDAATDMEYAAETLKEGEAGVRFVPVCDYDIPEGFQSYVLYTPVSTESYSDYDDYDDGW